MYLLAAAAGAVMLIVCTNLSTLLLARSPKRRRDMAIQSAVGATRHRLVSQLLIESLFLAAGGALVGLLIALGTTRAVAAANGLGIPMLGGASVDGLTLLFTLGLASAAALLLGIVPALKVSGGREAGLINNASRGSSEGRGNTSFREGLIVAEVALACVLLVGAGLLIRSFKNVLDVELGFQADETVAWRIAPSRPFDNPEAKSAYFDQFVRAVEGVPGVEAVGMTDALPLDRDRSLEVRAGDVDYSDGEVPSGNIRIIGPGYLNTMRIALLSGRNFSQEDSRRTPRVTIINETAAERLFPGQEPVGRVVLAGEQRYPWRVVGVVSDVRHRALEQEAGLGSTCL